MASDTMKLHEVVAVRKGVKSRTYSELTELFKRAQRDEFYNGLSREFTPLDDDGETFPPESKQVQLVADDVLKKVQKLRTQFLDIEATQEWGNLEARGDVEIDGQVILQDVPATMLIFLEKELNDLHGFVSAMPVLDEARTWTRIRTPSCFGPRPCAPTRPKRCNGRLSCTMRPSIILHRPN